MNKDLINEVKEILDEVDETHRYSMSKIYRAYNKVFGKSEPPQSCASCLIRKVRELRKWLEEAEISAERRIIQWLHP